MNVHLFSRGDAARVSGGFLYNRQLMSALERAGHRVVYHPDGRALDAVGPDDTCVIDAWVLPELEERLLASPGKMVLLLHMDPVTSGTSPSAALLARSRVLVTSEATGAAVRALPGAESVDLRCVEPGVPRGWDVKTRYAETATRLLCVANYVAGKGYLRLLDALDGLRESRWELRAFGATDLDPAYAERVRLASEARDWADRVSLGASIDHAGVGREMIGADLLLMISRRESYSIVTAEAIACGLPVLSHPTGARDAFRRSGRVRYVDAADPDALREALGGLISDPEVYAELTGSRRGRSRRWETVGAEIVEWLEAS